MATRDPGNAINQAKPAADPQKASPARRLVSDRERTLMGEIKSLQAAMRAASDDPNLSPLHRSAAIARHRSKYLQKADELRSEIARRASRPTGDADTAREQIERSKDAARKTVRNADLTSEQRRLVVERHKEFVEEKPDRVRRPKPAGDDDPFPY